MVTKPVRWSEEEKERIADGVANMRMKDPNASLITLTNRYIAQFPRERQRVIKALEQIKWLQPMVAKKYHEIKSRQEKPPEIIKHPELSLSDMLAKIPTRVLLAEVMERLYSDQRDMLKRLERIELNQAKSAISSHTQSQQPLTTVTSSVIQQKRILIVGLEPHQHHYILTKYNDWWGLIKFRFYDGKTKAELPTHIDHVVIMTKFINHSAQDLVIKTYGREKMRYCDGGISALESILKELIDK